MQVKDVMNKNVVSVSPGDTLSRALSLMRKYRVHQLPVMSNGNLYGMLELKKIVSRDVDVPTTKVSTVATNVPQIDANASMESAVDLLLRSGVRAVPVTDGGAVVGIISESDMMKIAKQFVKGLNQGASEIASPAEYIDKKGNYGNVKRIISEKNISRVPVIENGSVLGVVSTLEMAKALEGRQTMETKGGNEKISKEKINLENVLATTIMRPVTVIQGDKMIDSVIEMLKDSEEVIVETDGSFGVITHKDVMELFAAVPKKQLYVQITGMHDESIEFKATMDVAVTEFVQKIGRVAKNIEYLVVHVEKMHKQGPKEKYSIRVRFKSTDGFFVAHSWGWKPLDVIQDAFKNLEREVVSRHGKVKDLARDKRQKERYK